MASERRPSFPFYPKDWLSSASVSAMPLAAQGLYVRLMAYAWQADGLPCSHEALRNLVGVSRSEWRKLWPHVAPMWRQENDRLFNRKLEAVRAESAAFSEQKRAAGQASAAAKAQRKANGTPTDTQQQDNEPDAESATKGQPASASASATANRSFGADAPKDTRATSPRAVVPFDQDHGAWPAQRQSPGHAWRSTIGKHVPHFLHQEFVDSLVNAGEADPETALLNWYAATESRHRGKPNGTDAPKFWRAAFAAWQGGEPTNTKQARQLSEAQRAVELTQRLIADEERRAAR